MSLEIYKQIEGDILDRKLWEDRQSTAYKLRHSQIRRKKKPYPKATDLSWPLIDTAIERLKPAFIEQIFGPEYIASFIAKRTEGQVFETEVARWFDYRVRRKSNFVKQAFYLADTFACGGKGFLKTYYDAEHKCVRHENIYPVMFVVPPWTEELGEADRACHIMQKSVFKYKRVAKLHGYNEDEDFIKSISGRGNDNDNFRQARELREGLGWHNKDDIIILWEIYERQPDNKIRVHTISPLNPGNPVKPSFILPYNHNLIPVVGYDFELTDVGFYSPRGVAEILALNQSVLKKLLDTQMDYIDYTDRPVWMPADETPLTNYDNIDFELGQVINARIQPLQWPQPPVDFLEAQQTYRTISQERIGAPDYGIGDSQNMGQGKKTATEIEQLGAVKASGINIRGRVLSMSLQQTLAMQWSLELQYKAEDLNYFYRGEYKELNAAALDQVYELEIGGPQDGFSREKRTQRLVQVGQVGRGQPYFNEPEWFHELLETIDPDLIKTLYIPQDVSQQQQLKAAVIAIVEIQNGFNPAPLPQDDDMAFIQAIEAYKVYAQQHPNKQDAPDVLIRLVQFEDAHIEALRKKKPQVYHAQKAQLQMIQHENKAAVKAIEAMLQQLLARQGQVGQMGGAQPGGPPQGPPGMPPPGPQPVPNGASPMPPIVPPPGPPGRLQ